MGLPALLVRTATAVCVLISASDVIGAGEVSWWRRTGTVVALAIAAAAAEPRSNGRRHRAVIIEDGRLGQAGLRALLPTLEPHRVDDAGEQWTAARGLARDEAVRTVVFLRLHGAQARTASDPAVSAVADLARLVAIAAAYALVEVLRSGGVGGFQGPAALATAFAAWCLVVAAGHAATALMVRRVRSLPVTDDDVADARRALVERTARMAIEDPAAASAVELLDPGPDTWDVVRVVREVAGLERDPALRLVTDEEGRRTILDSVPGHEAAEVVVRLREAGASAVVVPA